ncbi:SUMO ligase siz1, partial [Kappamyces sp. JEL0680]
APVVMAPSMLFDDVKILCSHRVGINAQKPPIGIRLNFLPDDSQLLEHVDSIASAKLHRVVILCVKSPSSMIAAPGSSLEFPPGCSITVNNEFIPMTTLNPSMGLDITNALRTRRENNLRISFYHAPVNYTFMLKLIKTLTSKEIIGKISQKVLSKEEVLASRKAIQDDDVVSGDETLALHDPFTRCRIDIPIRSRNCSHPQCFDAATFLQVTRTSKKVECPICYSKLDFNDLLVDGFFQDILRNTAADVEHVILSHDGTWRAVLESPLPAKKETQSVSEVILLDDDDSDIPIIKRERPVASQETVWPDHSASIPPHIPLQQAAPVIINLLSDADE